MIVGITGTLGAGKDSIAEMLMEHGFCYHSLSDIIRDQMRRKGAEITLANMTEFADNLRKEEGPSILARVVLERIEACNEKHSLVVSIRNMGELEELRKSGRFVMVAVNAPIELRYERIRSRKREDDNVTLDEFKRIESIQNSDDPNNMHLNRIIEAADYRIMNDSDLESLKNGVDGLIAYLKAKAKEFHDREISEKDTIQQDCGCAECNSQDILK